MTFQSSTLLAFSSRLAAFQLTTANPDARVLYRLQGMAGFTPYELVDWAKKHHLPVAYVDGAWVRVPADRQTVLAFLSGRVDPDQLERILQDSAERGERLVLDAEEY